MNITLIGYGKMGQLIHKLCHEQDINVLSTIDPNNQRTQFKEITDKRLKDCDVAIDFSLPSEVLSNIKAVSGRGVNIVVGTTGWQNDLTEAKKIIKANSTGLIWASNFSIGANAFFQIVRQTAAIFDKFPEYDIFAHEFHHKGKVDSPSGTAQTIGEILVNEINRKKKIVTDKLDRQIEADEIHLSSTRGGSVPGTHSVYFDSEADTIELKHTARSRLGFAVGAVTAARWIIDKKGIFTMEDLLNEPR